MKRTRVDVCVIVTKQSTEAVCGRELIKRYLPVTTRMGKRIT